MSLVELFKSWEKHEREWRDMKPKLTDEHSRVYSIAYRKGIKRCMKDLSDYINKNIKHNGMRCSKCKTMNLHEVSGVLCCAFCGENSDADKLFLQRFEQINEDLNTFLRLSNEASKQKIRQSLIDLHAIIIS